MISLPPGCTVNYNIRIIVSDLTEEMIEWATMVGATYAEVNEGWSYRGKPATKKVLSFNNAKPSYQLKDGSKNVILTFNGSDASTASMFLIKFTNYIISHNLKEYETYVY